MTGRSESTDAPGVDVLRRSFEIFNQGDLDACVALLSPDFVANIAGTPVPQHGPDAWRRNAATFRDAFPDLNATIDDIFGVDDRVAVRLTFEGTHRGTFYGIEPTGRRVRFTSIELYRVDDDRIAEEWVSPDATTLMGQLTSPQDPR